MLVCPQCGNDQEFVLFKCIHTPIKVDGKFHILESDSSKIPNVEPVEVPIDWHYKIICNKCYRSGSYSSFNVIDKKYFMKE